MVLRWYLILLAIGFIGIVIICIIEQEKGGPFEERKNLAFLGKFLNSVDVLIWIYGAIKIIYIVCMILYCIIEHHFIFMGIPILEILAVIFIVMSYKIKAFNSVTDFFGMVFFAVWLLYILFFCMSNDNTPLGEEKITQNKEIVQTINIVEFTQAPYNKITGSRYYIKSSPENVYYYEIITERGGTTTQIIDGSNYYVEKFANNKYINNPHIDIEKVTTTSEYTNWFGNNVTEENVEYKYYIYIPEDATFYEQ